MGGGRSNPSFELPEIGWGAEGFQWLEAVVLAQNLLPLLPEPPQRRPSSHDGGGRDVRDGGFWMTSSYETWSANGGHSCLNDGNSSPRDDRLYRSVYSKNGGHCQSGGRCQSVGHSQNVVRSQSDDHYLNGGRFPSGGFLSGGFLNGGYLNGGCSPSDGHSPNVDCSQNDGYFNASQTRPKIPNDQEIHTFF